MGAAVPVGSWAARRPWAVIGAWSGARGARRRGGQRLRSPARGLAPRAGAGLQQAVDLLAVRRVRPVSAASRRRSSSPRLDPVRAFTRLPRGARTALAASSRPSSACRTCSAPTTPSGRSLPVLARSRGAGRLGRRAGGGAAGSVPGDRGALSGRPRPRSRSSWRPCAPGRRCRSRWAATCSSPSRRLRPVLVSCRADRGRGHPAAGVRLGRSRGPADRDGAVRARLGVGAISLLDYVIDIPSFAPVVGAWSGSASASTTRFRPDSSP